MTGLRPTPSDMRAARTDTTTTQTVSTHDEYMHHILAVLVLAAPVSASSRYRLTIVAASPHSYKNLEPSSFRTSRGGGLHRHAATKGGSSISP